MKKVLLLMMLMVCMGGFAQDYTYNCWIENNKDAKVKDTVSRKIVKSDNSIIVTNYYSSPAFDNKDLVLIIDSVVPKRRALDSTVKDWYYCTCSLGFKYILLGLNTNTVNLFNVLSEIEVYEDVFNSLK